MNNLTVEEIQILMEGLDALESSAAQNMMMGTLLGAMLSGDKESAKEHMENEQREFEEKKAERELLRERIILVKAKLISMKDKAFVSEIGEEIN